MGYAFLIAAPIAFRYLFTKLTYVGLQGTHLLQDTSLFLGSASAKIIGHSGETHRNHDESDFRYCSRFLLTEPKPFSTW